MTHKLARILWHPLKFRDPFNPEAFAQAETRLQNSTAIPGFTFNQAQ